jgi:uncharacterized membrane protein YedE/YeeE
VRRALGALSAGLLFGGGLVVSGMTDPRNVVGFLDFTGHWNPSLAAVMLGAIAVHATALRVLGARGGVGRWAPPREAAPWLDARLVAGSAVFGVGWGLAGYCPGPALVALGFGAAPAWGFVGAMIVGVLLGEGVSRGGATSSEGTRDQATRGVPAC